MRMISVPIMPFLKYRNPEREVEWFRKMGVGRVFLCLSIFPSEKEKAIELIHALKPHIDFLHKEGFEVGVWYWAFWLTGENSYSKITGFDGKTDAFCCPSDPDFRRYIGDLTREVGKLHPDLILLDDDLRFGYLPVGLGCICHRHRNRIEREIGKLLPQKPQDIFDTLFSGKPNEARSAWLHANGESIADFCKALRSELDSVAPEVRLGACACLTSYDADGIDAFNVAHLLAGSTKPFMRLIGAPYWASEHNLGYRLQDVVETERLERSWYPGDDIEIMSEGDCYPRPRFTCPSSYLEIFDTALLFSGKMSGILKYTFDYASANDYETGYIRNHIRNIPIYEKIEEITEGKKSQGIRVWETMRKLEGTDFGGNIPTVDDVQGGIISHSSRTLSCHAVPTVYEGNGIAGIAFGENARFLPDSAFEKPLILDLPGALILQEKGIDVGIRSLGGGVLSPLVDIPEFGDTFKVGGQTVAGGVAGGARLLTVSDGAKTIGNYPEAEQTPYAFAYTDSKGRNFLVLNFDGTHYEKEHSRNYFFPRVIERGLAYFDVKLPAVVFDCPDLYLQMKAGPNGEKAIGLWNCSADAVYDAILSLDFQPTEVSGIGCEPVLSEKGLLIPTIPAYGFCFVTAR